jgi:hypothetical protein
MAPPLLALDEVQRRLRVVSQSYAGVGPIEVRRIIGSVDRSMDFDREFRPRLPDSAQRMASLRARFRHQNLPPIEAYEVGGAYFVADGHHRVALAMERDAEFIDAEVTRLETNFEIGPDTDVCRLIHTEQQARLFWSSGLACVRPDAVIEFSLPSGYPELLELIKAHGYDLARKRGELPSREEVAEDWYDHVYVPGVEALHREGLPAVFDYKTDADLFLWVHRRHRSMRVDFPCVDFAEAARDALTDKLSARYRRHYLRTKSAPLRRRSQSARRES